MEKEYGVRWTETRGREMRVVTNEKFFATDAARARFSEKLEDNSNFLEFLAWSDPRPRFTSAQDAALLQDAAKYEGVFNA